MTWQWIRFALSAACLVTGLVFMMLAVFGVNRFHRALNRMHAAAMGDTLGILFVFAGLILIRGFSMASFKLLLVILFFWTAGPVSGHMISRLEAMTDEDLGEILVIRKEKTDKNRRGRKRAMKLFEIILLICLIVCAVSVAFTKDLLTSIVIFMSYSLIMCIIWILLQSPDLAITEAAVGAGVTSILFFITLKKIRAIRKEERDEQDEGSL